MMASDDEYTPPEKRYKRTAPRNPRTAEPLAPTCIICNGSQGPLGENEVVRTITDKGLNTLRNAAAAAACRKSTDDVNTRISQLSGEDLYNIKFHESCRAMYTHKDRQPEKYEPRKLNQTEVSDVGMGTPLLRSTVAPFKWQSQCVVCGKAPTRDTLSSATKDPCSFHDKLKKAATRKRDSSGKIVLHRLSTTDPSQCLRYHRKCYRNFIHTNINEQKTDQTHTQLDDTLRVLGDELEPELFVHKKVIFLKIACSRYEEIVAEKNGNGAPREVVRAFWLKNKLKEMFGERIVFYSQNGSPDVFCTADLSIGSLLKDLQFGGDKPGDTAIETDGDIDESTSDIKCLHRAVGILRKDIEGIEETSQYHSVQQVSLEASEQFVPSNLAWMIQMLLDKEAFMSADITHSSSSKIRRWYIALAECVVYCSRRGEHQVIPPLHVGLLLQMHHQFGSRDLIDTLHGHGFCPSYDELRLFLSAAADKEIQNQSEGFMPPGVVSREEGGNLIQEGNDNIDINVKTIDGKDTYHAMARVVFQQQDSLTYQPCCTSIPRPKVASAQNRSLKVDAKTKTDLTKPMAFKKPKQRPQPPRRKDPLDLLKKLSRHPIILPRDLAWVLLRNNSRERPTSLQMIPMWTGFNTSFQEDSGMFTLATYAPTIEAPPTDMGTVYTTLKKGQELVLQAGQHNQIHTFDQQLYAIAQQIKWANGSEFSALINRLGGFHTMCSFIACIGKIWGDGGLKDMLVDSGVYASSTADQMMSGRQFHRAVRGLTLCFEALMVRYVSAFIEWCDQQQKHKDILRRLDSVITDVRCKLLKEHEEGNKEAIIEQIEEHLQLKLIPLLMKFGEEMSAKSATFMYWLICLKTLQVLLLNIRAERTGDWLLHLQTVMSMMPFFFTCNHQNYSRWATSYLIDMLSDLPPDVEAAFMDGQFSIRRKRGVFNAIWSDMGVESTVIRDSKAGNRGIVGKTHQETTALRWCLTNLLLGQYTTEMRHRTTESSVLTDKLAHEQTKPAQMTQDEAHVSQIVQHIDDNMTDPFCIEAHPNKLVNIASGLHATDEVQRSLMSALPRGKTSFERFVDDRFTDSNNKSFWDPIPKSGLKTFTDMNKKTPVKIMGRHVNVNISAENVFRRALAISESREDVTVASILRRPITTVPTMLFKEDGTKRKTQKADIVHWLEKQVPGIHERPKQANETVTAYIIDGMAEVQTTNGDRYRTFDDLGQGFLDMLLSYHEYSNEVHLVFDRYDDPDSVKREERIRRTGSGFGQAYDIIGGRVIPKWKKFLDVISNKEALTYFLSDYAVDHVCLPDDKACRKRLYAAGGFKDIKKAVCVDVDGQHVINELSSSQEEADTRMFLHLANFDRRCSENGIRGQAIIKSPDTDVVVLAIHFFPQLASVDDLWIEMGNSSKLVDHHRFLPVHDICKAIGNAMCRIFPAVHAVTGCDNVSSLHGIGKRSVMKVVSEGDGKNHEDMVSLGGTSFQEAVTAARKLFLKLYCTGKNKAVGILDLNDLRVLLAKGNTSVARLPPSEAAFAYHVRRASWQTRVWMSATDADANMESPVGNGWCREDELVVPKFFDGPTACEMLTELVCNCKGRNRCGGTCSCRRSNLMCIDLCSCDGKETCCNPHTMFTMSPESEEAEERY